MQLLLLCLLALGVQARRLDDKDDSEISNAASLADPTFNRLIRNKNVGKQDVLLKRKHRKLSPSKKKKEKIKVNSQNRQDDDREALYHDADVIPEPQEYRPPIGGQKKLSPIKKKREKSKVSSKIKQEDSREAFSHDVIPEPQEYRPPHGKQKVSKLSGFSVASMAQGVQFIADIVTIVSSDFWKWINDAG